MGKSLSYNDRRKNCLFPLFSIFNHCGVVCRISIFIHCISLAIEFAVFKNLLFFIYFLRLKLSLISEAAVIPSSMHYWIDYYSKNIYKSEIQSRDQKKSSIEQYIKIYLYGAPRYNAQTKSQKIGLGGDKVALGTGEEYKFFSLRKPNPADEIAKHICFRIVLFTSFSIPVLAYWFFYVYLKISLIRILFIRNHNSKLVQKWKIR